MPEMENVVVDQKKRVRLPKKISDAFKIRSKEILTVTIEDEKIVFSRPKKNIHMSPMLRDMFERPLHSKVPITKELLDALEEEQWSGL